MHAWVQLAGSRLAHGIQKQPKVSLVQVGVIKGWGQYYMAGFVFSLVIQLPIATEEVVTLDLGMSVLGGFTGVLSIHPPYVITPFFSLPIA